LGTQLFRSAWDGTEGARLGNRILSVNFDTYLLDDLLVKADRMSMAHGLEVRSPFLDRELTEFAFRLSPELKMRGLSLKRVLRAAMNDLLPGEVASRRKAGFSVPVDRWFRTDLRSFIESRLGSKQARTREHLRGSAIDTILAEHRDGVRDHGAALWTLLTLELFLRREGW
jgi:asparagine synthase (glutamine-hydrolysing)